MKTDGKAWPYVGVTGVTTVDDTEQAVRAFKDTGFSLEYSHLPMLGFLVSYKTLNGESTLNRRYPAVSDLPEMLEVAQGEVYSMIHYNTRSPSSLASQLETLFDGLYNSGRCRAVQLNIVNPPVDQLDIAKQKMPELDIVLQLSSSMLAGTTIEIHDTVHQYSDFANYVLIDPSSGNGRQFNMGSSVSVYNEIVSAFPDLTVGFAGGFASENVSSRVVDLIRLLGSSDFCIDAEGGLRDKVTGAYGDDLFNVSKIRGYLEGAALFLQ